MPGCHPRTSSARHHLLRVSWPTRLRMHGDAAGWAWLARKFELRDFFWVKMMTVRCGCAIKAPVEDGVVEGFGLEGFGWEG